MTTPPATDLALAKLDVALCQTLASKFALFCRLAGKRSLIQIDYRVAAPVTLFGLPDTLAAALALGFLIASLKPDDDTCLTGS
jgi:hypothetical protein